MALQVWLPLNGNLNNQGLSEYNFTNKGATNSSSGKIGSCYSFDGTDDRIYTTGVNFTSTQFSIGCWFNASFLDTTTQYLISLGENAGTAEQQFAIYMNSTGIIYVTGGETGTKNYTLSTNTWYHIMLTFDGAIQKLYLNGELIGSSTNFGTFIGTNLTIGARSNSESGAGNSAAYFFNGLINDVRIYDECISVKEIKELAKGLCLHYKLSGVGVENLLVNSDFANGITNWGGVNSSSVSTKMIDDKLTLTATKGTTNNLFCQYFGQYSTLGKVLKYTFSADIYVEEEGTFSLRYYVDSTGWKDATQSTTFKKSKLYPGWNKVEVETLVSQSTYTGQLIVSLGCNTSSTMYMYHPKLEVNNKATPWCPNPADALYSTMGFNDGIEYDCSGLGNDGTINGEIVWSGNTPRYNGSYYLGGTGYIKNDNLGLTTNEFTISFWVKPPSTITSQHFLFGTFDTWTKNGVGYYRDASNSSGYAGIIKSDAESSYTNLNLVLNMDTWTFVTIVYTGTECLLYKDGVLSLSKTYGSGGTVTHPVCYVGNSLYKNAPDSETDESSVVDFRLYTTALSAEDILSMYNSPISLSSDGTLFASSFEEV